MIKIGWGWRAFFIMQRFKIYRRLNLSLIGIAMANIVIFGGSRGIGLGCSIGLPDPGNYV